VLHEPSWLQLLPPRVLVSANLFQGGKIRTLDSGPQKWITCLALVRRLPPLQMQQPGYHICSYISRHEHGHQSDSDQLQPGHRVHELTFLGCVRCCTGLLQLEEEQAPSSGNRDSSSFTPFPPWTVNQGLQAPQCLCGPCSSKPASCRNKPSLTQAGAAVTY